MSGARLWVGLEQGRIQRCGPVYWFQITAG
jgi:hypothetical protein